MTFCSKISKIIHTQLKKYSEMSIILKLSVNYFGNFKVECYLLKIVCNEFSFTNIESVIIIYSNY